MQKKLATEVMLTLERYSLNIRDRCMQNSMIANRLHFEDYYNKRVTAIINDERSLNEEKVRRMKAIFANSDAIFDSGFIGFLNTYLEISLNQINLEANKIEINSKDPIKKIGANLFVYEYLHENRDIQAHLKPFKKFLKKDFTFSTHFDGLDYAFGIF